MKVIKTFDRFISILFITTILVIAATSYFTFEKTIRNHIQHQQEATIPLFSLITSEVIRPLSVSSFIANDSFLIAMAESSAPIDKRQVETYLERLSSTFNMLAFIAFEKHGFMIDSNNKSALLTSETAEWYHRLKAQPAQQFVDIGNAQNPHVFFDIKLRSASNEFLGFAGIGIDLDHFATKFKTYYDQFGIELFFVDANGKIILTSTQLIKTDTHRRKNVVNINTLPWYKDYYQRSQRNSLHSNIKVENINEKYNSVVVSNIPIPELNWHVYIVSPPANEQREFKEQLASKLLLILFVALIFYFIFDFLLTYFKSTVVKDSEIDYLTKLPNRSYVNWRFEQLNESHKNVSVVIADIDHFKSINDQYGHLVGDDVLIAISKIMQKNVREIDLIGRWGGEEFIMILPDTDIHTAHAVIERLRISIEKTAFNTRNHGRTFNVTMSFGIAFDEVENLSLETILSQADHALYQAKNSGRNQVVTQAATT